MTTQDTTDRTDYMVDDHDPLDAAKALEAANLMMSQMKAQPEYRGLMLRRAGRGMKS